MRRGWVYCASIVALSACGSTTGTDSAGNDATRPAAVISDGNHLASDPNGNPDFFFLPPMTANPSNSPNWSPGQFNAALQPTVTICQLNLPSTATEANVTAATACKAGGYSVTFNFNPDGVVLHPTPDPDLSAGITDAAHYHVNWSVPNNPAVFYRVFVRVGTVQVGFADVETRAQSQDLKNVDAANFVGRKDGTALPILFRIENNALCSPPGDYSQPCASATIDLTQGGTLATTVSNLPAGITIPPQNAPSTQVATFTIQPCGPGGIQVDLPVFGSCLNITSTPVMTIPFADPALVFVCDYPPDVSLVASQQSEMVELHARHSATFTEALVGADGHCPVSSAERSGSIGGMLASAWRGDWKSARRELLHLFRPEPLMAMFLHAGGGGLVGFQSDFQFALPAKMEIDQGDGAIVGPGSTIAASVKVTDLFGGPVANARVHFAVTSGGGSVSPAVVLSDGNGIASVQWTLGSAPGPNTLEASGFGIAAPTVHGPRGPGDFQPHTLSYGCGTPPCAEPAQSFDPFIPKYLSFDGLVDAQAASPSDGTGGVPLQRGAVTFSATGASPVNVFDYGSGGYVFRRDIQFDGTNPRTGGESGGGAVPPANWFSPAFTPPGGDWLTGLAAFGSRFLGCAINSTQSGDLVTDHFATDWSIFTDIVVRKTFTTAYGGTLSISVRIDNDVKIWLDGVEITPNAASTGNGGYDAASGWWFHDNCADAGNPVFVVTGVPAGNHLLAIRGHDYGGAAYLDAKVDLAP